MERSGAMRSGAEPLRKALGGRVTVDRWGAIVERRPSVETIEQH
ncbi:MAG: hypothetical protein ABSD13_20755 [Candidatus Korobacteraceae bacterium]